MQQGIQRTREGRDPSGRGDDAGCSQLQRGRVCTAAQF